MTDMYDPPKAFKGKLNPYPHSEKVTGGGRAEDPVAFLRGVEQRARERQVAIETVRLLRQKVIHCYRKEGVNHYENCKKVSQEFFDTIVKKDMGQLQPDWADKEMMDGW